MNQKKYYRSSELKQRGWTDGLIKKFLPKPDETKTNPVIKSAAPMKLYKIKRFKFWFSYTWFYYFLKTRNSCITYRSR